MADAFQCDRPACEAFQLGKPLQVVTAPTGQGSSRTHHLCDTCLLNLQDWLAEPHIEDPDHA